MRDVRNNNDPEKKIRNKVSFVSEHKRSKDQSLKDELQKLMDKAIMQLKYFEKILREKKNALIY